ncbi:MAG TPA: hypothetical protein VMS31_20060 [Pyrinomonadaceae bacterium]|nr:hypothetical protein [Pyrinomonadaceae bacterium]
MLKIVLVILASASSLAIVFPGPTSAQTTAATNQSEKIKGQVAKLGEGAHVSVRLIDKKKLTGDINYVGPDFFMMTNAKTKTSQKLAYSDVVRVERKDAQSFPTWGKVVLGVVGAVAVISYLVNVVGVD